MGFAQLYYTSCESGLSDFAGFQFNAATPGLPAQVLREVEALTSYEPPRSLGYRPSSEEIAACPVNLVYRCEPTTVLANVVFVGLDFSQRLGNYFAHALVGQADTDRFDRILPIELWGSPVWADEPITDRELPALADLPHLAEPADPPGAQERPISRAGVDRFLAENQRPEQVAALVTAAETAVLRQGRSIVIIDADSTAAAHWIAAISFLLPPVVARRMSFATYRHRPEYSDAHVIATLPESDFDLDDSTFHSYVVFDAGSGRISEVTPDPAAALLVRAGAEDAAGLWDRAGDLVDLTEFSLAQCHPVLVAAAVLDRRPVSGADLSTLGEWLHSDPGGLAPADRSALLEAALAHLAKLVSEDPDAVIEVFAGPLGDSLVGPIVGPLGELLDGPIERALPPDLHRAALLARCRRALVPAAEPGTATQDWLVQAIVEPGRDGHQYLPAYRSLCRAIEDGTVTVSLPGAAKVAVTAFLATIRELEQAGAETDQVQASILWRLAGSYAQQGAIVQDLLLEALPGLIDGLAGSRHLVDAVAGCPEAVVAAYLETASRRAERIPPDVDGVTLLFTTLHTLRSGQDPVLAPGLDEVLRRSLRDWSPDQLDRLREHLRSNDSGLAASFGEWRGQHLGGLLSRSFRRLARRGTAR